TAKATDEIGAQISGIQSATQEAVAAIESITKTISQINEVNSGVASAVEEQGAATQEIARNVEQAAAGTHEVSSNIVSVNQAANETGAAADKIRNSSIELSQQADILHTEVGKFLGQVRAERSEMKLLDWTDDLVCGLPEIDRDHRRLVDMANDAYGRMMAGEEISAMDPLVKDLGAVVAQHFADEERAMTRIGYPDLAHHKKLHRELVDRFKALHERFAKGDKGAAKDLFIYLAKWMKEHTFNQDRAFIAYARKGGKEKLLRAA
ncbi:MAG: bacteriohemerythrin, partial [Rhodospirillales bacterium]|nr:bacteriohemerythrin [Rhodospirillales bacterium]